MTTKTIMIVDENKYNQNQKEYDEIEAEILILEHIDLGSIIARYRGNLLLFDIPKTIIKTGVPGSNVYNIENLLCKTNSRFLNEFISLLNKLISKRVEFILQDERSYAIYIDFNVPYSQYWWKTSLRDENGSVTLKLELYHSDKLKVENNAEIYSYIFDITSPNEVVEVLDRILDRDWIYKTIDSKLESLVDAYDFEIILDMIRLSGGDLIKLTSLNNNLSEIGENIVFSYRGNRYQSITDIEEI